MAEIFHFFTNNENLIAQVGTDPYFGPVVNNETTQYRLNSLHKTNSDQLAYLVCSGFILIQPSTNSSFVNIILKPTVQPTFNFVPIKYFIYRGIKLTSLINGSQVANSGTNDLTTHYWAEQAKNNTQSGNTDPAPVSMTGFNYTVANNFLDSDPISKAFDSGNSAHITKKNDVTFSIGLFDKDNIGFEIVLDRVGFEPELEIARSADHIITIPAAPVNNTHKDTFQYYHFKEEILDFMDPCSFYGSFAAGASKNPVGAFLNGNFGKLKTQEQLFSGIINKFQNKNVVYIDIRNEHNHSFDYYKNYGSLTPTSLTNYTANVTLKLDHAKKPPQNSVGVNRNYYSGWPILTLINSDFSTGCNINRNYIQIQLPEGDNASPLLYLSQGYLNLDYPKQPETLLQKFITLTSANGLTSKIFLAVPNNGITSTNVISCYIRLNYLKTQFQTLPTIPDTVIRTTNYLENIFPINLMKIPVSMNPSVLSKSTVYEAEHFINGVERSFIAKIGIAEDTQNVIFFAFASELYRPIGSRARRFSIIGELDLNNDNYLIGIIKKHNEKLGSSLTHIHERLRKSQLNISQSSTPNYLQFKSEAEINGVQKNSFDYKELIVLAVTKTEYNNIINLISTSPLPFLPGFPIYLAMRSKADAIDARNVPYTAFELILRGYDEGNNNILETKEISLSTTLQLYSYGTV